MNLIFSITNSPLGQMASISALKLHHIPQKKFPINTWVCALIDEDNSYWLEDWIRDEFLPHEACLLHP